MPFDELAEELRARCLSRRAPDPDRPIETCTVDQNPNSCPMCRAAAALEEKDSALFLLVSSDVEWPARVELRMAVERCRSALSAIPHAEEK